MLTLDATLLSDLEWDIPSPLPSELFLDLGLFDRLPKPLDDDGQFRSLELAIEHFLSSVPIDKIKKVYLYRGPADFGRDDGFLFRNQAARYLSQLSACFPVGLKLALDLDVSQIDSPLTKAFLTARDVYERFSLTTVSDRQAPTALLLPSVIGFYPELEAYLKKLKTPYRIIPEAYLTLEWAGLDTLIVAKEALDIGAYRKVQGFLAAGGELVTC